MADITYYKGWPIKDDISRKATIDAFEDIEKQLDELAKHHNQGIEEFQKSLINRPVELIKTALPLLDKKILLMNEMEKWLVPSNRHLCANNSHAFKENPTSTDLCHCGRAVWRGSDRVVDMNAFRKKQGDKK